MKTLLPLALLASIALSACGSAPSDITGNGRVSMGIAASDGASSVTVTRTVNKDTGAVSYAPGTPGLVTFTFMNRPGSDAAYIRGYRITRYNFNGTVDTTVSEDRKLDVYVPSGYTCPERIAGTLPSYLSCTIYNTDGSRRIDTVPANSLPIQGQSLNFAGALASEVIRTGASVYSEVDLEFFGDSSNGAPVSIKVTNIRSTGVLSGS